MQDHVGAWKYGISNKFKKHLNDHPRTRGILMNIDLVTGKNISQNQKEEMTSQDFVLEKIKKLIQDILVERKMACFQLNNEIEHKIYG